MRANQSSQNQHNISLPFADPGLLTSVETLTPIARSDVRPVRFPLWLILFSDFGRRVYIYTTSHTNLRVQVCPEPWNASIAHFQTFRLQRRSIFTLLFVRPTDHFQSSVFNRFPAPLSNASHGSKVLLIVIHTLLYQELENEMKVH
jgi:hypothetical protein